MKKKEKIKVGMFSLTSCAGCQLAMLNLDKTFFDILDNVEFTNFKMLKEENDKGPFDIAIIEGSATTREEIKELRKIEKVSKFIIAFGACATFGGIPAIKDFYHDRIIEREVYGHVQKLSSVRIHGIGQYIKVDYYMRGCPIHKEEFFRVIKDMIAGKKPVNITDPVCVECRLKENACLLQQGKPCMGPITYGGCDALCTSVSVVCTGCNGPCDDANVAAEAKLFKEMGISEEDIQNKFRTFAGTSKIFREYCKLCKVE
jgi:coenzyme F420-reducing hydrogenase gamma subunit